MFANLRSFGIESSNLWCQYIFSNDSKISLLRKNAIELVPSLHFVVWGYYHFFFGRDVCNHHNYDRIDWIHIGSESCTVIVPILPICMYNRGTYKASGYFCSLKWHFWIRWLTVFSIQSIRSAMQWYSNTRVWLFLKMIVPNAQCGRFTRVHKYVFMELVMRQLIKVYVMQFDGCLMLLTCFRTPGKMTRNAR